MIERESQQAERRRRPALSARSFLFGILALSIAVLSLAAVPSSVASLARNGEAGFAVFVRGAPCVADAHSGDAPPAHSGDHAQCCVICGARDFDGAAVASSIQNRRGGHASAAILRPGGSPACGAGSPTDRLGQLLVVTGAALFLLTG